jgi:hypothetical protein
MPPADHRRDGPAANITHDPAGGRRDLQEGPRGSLDFMALVITLPRPSTRPA